MSRRAPSTRADSGTTSALPAWRAHLAAMLGGPIDLPMLSPAAAAIAAMAADPDSNTSHLAQHVQRDPAIAASVLRIANSAAYAPAVPIVSLQQAISWLGMGEIQSIAIAVWVRGQIFAAQGHEKLLTTMWQEAAATACWAREVARLGRTSVELAHLCGLLHRIGRPVVVRWLVQVGTSERTRLTGPERSHLIAEFEQRAGLALATSWALPEPVLTAIAKQDDESYDGEWRLQLRQVRLAEILAARMLEQTLDVNGEERLARALDALNIYPDQLEALEARTETVQSALSALA